MTVSVLDSLPLHDTVACAKRLLGMDIVRKTPLGVMRARIVETEAYHQDGDEASHSFRGQTNRNAVMFGPPGFLYVYLIYGMHFCMNVVTEAEGIGAAVLIRALEPLEGLDLMRANRPKAKRAIDLTNGPAKACQALDVDLSLNGTSLKEPMIHLGPGISDLPLVSSRRIGITKSVELPWRFYVPDHPFVSKEPKSS